MSNALVIGSKRSTTGKPLFVAGPQVGQYYPQIMLELDLDGGGYRARGAAFPGISFGILLGRGIDYAWSATSAGSDLVDQYVETLCGGSDTMYLYRGECRQMTTFDAGTIVGRPGEPDQQLVYPETVHGPVQGYATVDGKRVAISVKRSTRGRELGSLGFFLDMSMNRVHSARDFVRAASMMELTFNWVYADSRSIAQFTSGRLPVRPATVDPGLPTKGTGDYEWQGFLPASAHAQTINPASGVILNWNNKPARGYAGADDEWTWGPVQRVDLLWGGIQRRQKHTLSSVVGAMNGAATQDLRLMRVWPVLRDVLARGTGTPRAAAAAAQLDAWFASGGSRLDADLDGKVDAPGAAVMDAAWSAIANAVLAPVLDGQERAELAKLVPNDPPLSANGSSAYSGWWSYVAEGPPFPARSRGRRPVPDAVLRRRRRREVRRFAVGGARHRNGAAGGVSGRRPVRVACRRNRGTDPVRARDPHDDDARLEQADVPAGDHASERTGRTPPREGRGVGSGAMADRPQKLLTPGPTSVPPSVLRALSKPVLHHRSPDFAAVFELAQERLREVFRTENEVLVLTSSGTGAFESAVVNLLSPGDRVLAVSQGEFGERWQAMARAFGCDVVPLAYPWGEAPRPAGPARGTGGKRRGDRLHRSLRDVDRRRLRSRAAARGVPRGRRALGGRCRFEPGRRSPRDRRMGRRTSS